MTPTKQILRRTLLAPTALLILTLPPAGPGQARAPAADRAAGAEAAVDPRLESVHASIESAFLRCDAGALRPVLSRRLKIYLSGNGFGDGYYGADQVLLLLERLFAGRFTIRFTTLAPPPRPQADGQAILSARWVSRDEDSSESDVRMIFVLAPEAPGWSVREIREVK